MAHNLKTLALVLFALFALSSLLVSSATATEFTAASYPVSYSGTQVAGEPIRFKADGYEVSCKNAEFSGEAKETSTTVTLTPSFSECTAFGLSATVAMNGCDYLLHLPAAGDEASADLVCPSGKEVTITAGGGTCVAHLTPFSLKLDVKFRLFPPKIKLKFTLSLLVWHLTDTSAFFCPFSGNTTVQNGTMEGEVELAGSSEIDFG